VEDSSQKNLSQLLEKAQAGDSTALHLLCKELEGHIRGYFSQKFQNKAIVDDLCQETYLRLLNNLLLIRKKMKLKSFVVKVALHVAQDYLRKKYRNIEVHKNNSKEMIKEVVRDNQNDTRILNGLDLENALNQLPEKSRNILMMKTQGYNYEEISAEMGLSESGVKMQVKRGLEQLRNFLYDVTFLFFVTTIYMKQF